MSSNPTPTPKQSKKLQAFLKDKSPNVKRYKTLIAYTESNPEVDEESLFFTENAELVFSVFYDKWVELESEKKKSTKNHVSDVTGALALLKKILIYLETNMIKKKWKYDKIGSIIQQTLFASNKQSIRLIGFELLLLFIQGLQTPTNEQINEQILLFSTSVNLRPFVTSIQSETNVPVKLKNFPADAKDQDSLIAPGNADPTKADSIELLSFFLDYISTKQDNIQFWFMLFKEFYLSMFYPKVFQEMGVLYKNDDTGFTMYCPYEIQALLISKLSAWAEFNVIVRVLWEPNNSPLMVEILRQSCLLPMSYHETIKKSIDVFKGWLTSVSKAEIFGEKIQSYWKSLIKHVLLVFSIRSSGEEMSAHQNICKQSLAVLNSFATEMTSKLEDDTWEVLQNAILNCAFEFINRLDKSPQEQGMSSVADPLFQILFFIWIKSQVTTTEMWAEFQKKVSSLVHWKATVIQWKEKIIQLTFILKDFIYNTNEVELLTGSKKVGKVSTTTPRDPKLDAISWNEDRITEIWFIMLDILGNLNKITDPTNFEIAMSCMKETIELLLQAEQEALQYDEQPPIPLFGVFLPVLLEASSSNMRLLKGMLIAHSTMSLLFCRQHAKPIDIHLLSHYYRALHMGLNSGKEPVIWEIISCTRNLFSLNLPGASVLIPDFLREIDRLFNSALLQNIPPEIEKNALTIINSLICYPNHFDLLEIPVVSLSDVKMNSSEFRSKISAILLSALNRENVSVKQTCLWGICVLISEDLFHQPRPDVIKSFIHDILQTCTHSNVEIAQTALDVLSLLASLYEKLSLLDQGIIVNIINQLSDNIISLVLKTKVITQNSSVLETIVSNHFYCVTEWLAAGGASNILKNAELTIKLCQSIEVGLFGELIKDREKLQDKDPKKDPKKDTKKVKGAPGTFSESYFFQLKNKPLHGSEAIKEAADIMLLNTMNHFNNFPCPAGPEQIVSELPEDDESKHIFFLYNDSHIISLSQTNESNFGSRLFVRDATGKYAWDSKILYQNFHKLLKSKDTVPVEIPHVNYVPVGKPVKEVTGSLYSRQKGDFPVFSQEVFLQDTDMMDQLLHYLAESHNECLPPSARVTSFFSPLIPSTVYRENIDTLTASLEQQSSIEAEKIKETCELTRSPLTLYPTDPASVSSFHYPRLMLSHLGFLSFDNLKRLHLADDNARFRRSLKDLDKISGRQVLKVGVVYVRESQEDQKVIFRNESGSKEYNDFLKGLGWSVDLKSHRGFMGGLDSNLTTGASAPYWANASNEVIFHTVTRMPTIDSDPQQIQKKRHIGNDIVHIIYSEHKRDYNPSTITSQFNDAHVIIYPLSNGLFRIQIYKKDKVSFFGPLLDEMVVNKRILPFLVRFTAMNANLHVRYATKGYKRTFTSRDEFIKETIKRYKTEQTFEDFLLTLFPLKGDNNRKLSETKPEEEKDEEKKVEEDEIHKGEEERKNTSEVSAKTSQPSAVVEDKKPETKQEAKQEDLRKQNENKRQEELRRSEELKRAEELKRQEEIKRIEEAKKAEELKRQEEQKRATEMKKLEEAKKQEEKEEDPKRRKSFFGFMKKVEKKDHKKDEDSPRASTDSLTRSSSSINFTSNPSSPTSSTSSLPPTSPQSSNSGYDLPSKPVGGVALVGTNPQVLNQELSSKSNPSPSSAVQVTSNEAQPPATSQTSGATSIPTTSESTSSQANPETSATPASNPPEVSVTQNPTATPTISTFAAPEEKFYSYDRLKSKDNIDNLDPNRLEVYLADDEFEKVFACNKDTFAKMPLWKQNARKRQLGLF